jgi:hypothetical protein
MGEAQGEREPCTRFFMVSAYRDATRVLWGEAGVTRLAAALLPSEATLLLSSQPPETWIPTRQFELITQAGYYVLCERHTPTFHRWVDHVVELGFGRTRRLLLSLANPPMLLRRAAELWREDHTHGTLGYVPLAVDAARLTLRDHPFVSSPVQRMAIAEGLRHAMSMTNVRSVTAEESTGPANALHVVLRWT